MKLVVNSQLLAQELRLLSKITPDKPTIPVLGYTLVKAEEGVLSLQATDLQMGLVTTCAAAIEVPGTTTLPTKKLLEMVEQLPNADVSITVDKGATLLVSGAFKSRLQTLPARDFPVLPSQEGDLSTLSGPALLLLIERTQYAIADKVQKFIMDGALLALSGEVMAMVTTDGKRLSLSTTTRTGGSSLSVVLPTKTLEHLLTQGLNSDVEFSQGPRHLFFNLNGRLLISRTLDGQFPNYERIIPRANNHVATVDRSPFASALRRVQCVADENSSVFLSFGAQVLTISSSNAVVGEADETIEVTYSGPPLKACVNGQFVLDFLGAARGESVNVSLKDGKSPILLGDGVDFINVVMPMRA